MIHMFENKLLALSCLCAVSGMASLQAHAVVSVPLISERNAHWVESAMCSVVLKTQIEAGQPLLPGNPIESMAVLPANCSGNVMEHATVSGGIRYLLQSGFRMTGVSHQTTALRTNPDGKVELLISAIYALERPQLQ